MASMKELLELQKIENRDAETANLKTVFYYAYPKYEKKKPLDETVRNAVDFMMDCRTSRLGGWKHTCPVCGEEKIMYKSCHNKSCPVCNGYENKEWLEFHRERLVGTKYLHLVFVLSEELNDMFLKNKKEMSRLFFKTVKKILKKIYGKLTGGIIITEHTEGSVLTLHHHLHCLVMLGVYDKETGKFQEISAGRYVVSKLKEEFEEEYKKGYRKIEKGLRKGKDKVEIDFIHGFSVWKAEKYKDSAEAVLKYFSNGVRGGCISNERIMKVTEKSVRFAYENEQTKHKWAVMELPIEEFLKRVLLHIPAERQKQVRKYGVFASSNRKLLEKCKEAAEGKKVSLETKKEKKKAKREIGEKVCVFCPVCKNIMKTAGEIAPVRREKGEKIPA